MPDEDRIAALEAQLAAMQAELRSLRAAATPAPDAHDEASSAQAAGGEALAQVTPRRHLLKALGAATGVAVVGGVASAPPAAANDGDALVIGATNVQNLAETTYLNYTPSTAPPTDNVFAVQSTAYTSSPEDVRAAIAGLADSGITTGVLGYTESSIGAGVVGNAFGSGVGVKATNGRANLHLVPQLLGAPTGRSDPHFAGEMLVDLASQLWFCTVSGTPGTWRRLSGPSSPGSLVLLTTPARVYDSRPTYPPAGVTKGVLTTGEARLIELNAFGGVPPGASAALVSLKATGTSASGYFSVYANGESVPTASSINWFQAGMTVANEITTRVDSLQRIRVRCASGTAHAVVDVVGYYR